MSVDISTFPERIADYIQGKVDSGEFPSADDVVYAAVLQMEEREGGCCQGAALDESFDYTPEEQAALKEIARMTPSNEELLRLAAASPPPPQWYQGDDERP